MAKLADICKKIPPPEHPLFVGNDCSLSEIHKREGGVLPECLREFGRIYGSGEFVGAPPGNRPLTVFNPYDPAYDSNILMLCEVYKDLREETPEYSPYPCYPEPNGVFPIAWGQGVLAYILLGENLERYQIVYENSSKDYEEYDLTFFDFFYNYFCHKIENRYFDDPIVFRPLAH